MVLGRQLAVAHRRLQANEQNVQKLMAAVHHHACPRWRYRPDSGGKAGTIYDAGILAATAVTGFIVQLTDRHSRSDGPGDKRAK